MAIPTVPPIVLLKKQNTGASATRTGHSVRPAPRNQVLSAIDRIREVNDCFLKCGRFLLCAHVQMIALNRHFVKYIVTQKRPGHKSLGARRKYTQVSVKQLMEVHDKAPQGLKGREPCACHPERSGSAARVSRSVDFSFKSLLSDPLANARGEPPRQNCTRAISLRTGFLILAAVCPAEAARATWVSPAC